MITEVIKVAEGERELQQKGRNVEKKEQRQENKASL